MALYNFYSPCHISALSLFLSLFPSSTYAASNPDSIVRTVFEFPVGTWIENLGVRSNGDLLLTRLDVPELDLLNPFVSNPQPVTPHIFPQVTALTGIAEISPDSWALGAGNFSFDTIPGGTLGSWTVWNADFLSTTSNDATFKKIADVSEALTIDGLCNLPETSEPENVLVGDLEEGVIRRVETATGRSTVVVNNSLTAAGDDPLFHGSGVNSIHVRDSILYFTNTFLNVFAQMPIKSDGTPAGEPAVITKVDKPTTEFYFDDFTFSTDGNFAFLTTGSGNSILRVPLDGSSDGEIVAGNFNSAAIAEPTSCQFGRTAQDQHILYVSTSGGLAAPVNGNTTIGAQIVAVDTSKLD
ncbi:MAG: hypothetical protein M1820_008629 [Bogoriella megaspora]|nr:MAG: hypothetical protein M1820_008629 [Bogoriella megaspora]